MKKSGWKKKAAFVLLPLLAVAAVCAAAAFISLGVWNAPTKGEAIGRYESPGSALLVLDVQNAVTRNSAVYGDTSGFLDGVNRAVALARESGMEVMYVLNVDGNNPIISLLAGGLYKKGADGVMPDSRLLVVNDAIYEKTKSDAFSSKRFEEALIALQVDTLYIAGADAAGCVYHTARGGLNRGYSIAVIEDAVITADEALLQKTLAQYAAEGIGTIGLSRLQEEAGQE